MADDNVQSGGFNLIKIDGAAVTKLIEVVSGGIGTLYKPRAIRQEADAEAYKVEVLAKAEANKKLIEFDNQSEIAQRAAKRLVATEINRQLNIEAVADRALGYLPAEVSDQPVSKDWQSRFFNKVQDVSDVEMQDLWAKVLANEVTKPKSSSVRLIEILSSISQEEAQTFKKLCTIASANMCVFKVNSQEAGQFDQFGISFIDLLNLKDIGLILNNDLLALRVHSDNTTSQNSVVISRRFTVELGNVEYYLFPPESLMSDAVLELNNLFLSGPGQELCKIIKAETNQEYVDVWLKEKLLSDYKIFEGDKHITLDTETKEVIRTA